MIKHLTFLLALSTSVSLARERIETFKSEITKWMAQQGDPEALAQKKKKKAKKAE